MAPSPKQVALGFAAGLALLVALALFRYGWAAGISFINDDFLFLERARTASFSDNWNAIDALGNVYRPLTRNLYFWAGRKLFGNEPGPYHLVNLGVYAAGLILMAFAARRLVAGAFRLPPSGTRATGAGLLAAVLFALHPAAGTPASWVCGIQDLLAVDLALAAILAHLSRRRWLYVLFYLGALLCKETAAFLFPLLALWDWMIEESRLGPALRRQAPVALVFSAWLFLNPWLPWNEMGRTIHSREPGHASLLGRLDIETLRVTVRSLFMVEPVDRFHWPYGPLATTGQVLTAAALLALSLRLLGAEDKPRPSGVSARAITRGAASLVLMALLWSLSAILPLITVISHFTYYAYYPALGLAAGLSALLTFTRLRMPGATGGLVVGVAAVAVAGALGAGAALVYPPALCDAHNIRRASVHLWNFRDDLQRTHPAFPESARVYFWNIPPWIGFQLADGPALRVWYDNPSLTGQFLSAYAPDRHRPSFFFGHDDTMRLVEIVRGLPDPQLAAPPPIYTAAHTDLGSTLAQAGETEAAIVEWRKVLQVDADFSDAAANLGMTLNQLGRHEEAAEVLARAVRLEPSAADIRLDLGESYLALGRYPEALAALEAYVTLTPPGAERDQINAVITNLRAATRP